MLLKDVAIQDALRHHRHAETNEGDALLRETRRILQQDLFGEKKILDHLKQYNRTFAVMNEEDADHARIFTLDEITRTAINFRLKFLESGSYRPEMPYETV